MKKEKKLNGYFLSKIFVLVVLVSVLPIVNFFMLACSLDKSLLDFAFNISLIAIPLITFIVLLKTNIIKKNTFSAQVWTAVFSYIVLFVFCFFNADVFVDVIDDLLTYHLFAEKSVTSVVFRCLIAVALFFMLTDALMKLFTYVRILNENKNKNK